MKTWDELKYSTISVNKNRELAQGAYLLSFKRGFNFMAGQVVAHFKQPYIQAFEKQRRLNLNGK